MKGELYARDKTAFSDGQNIQPIPQGFRTVTPYLIVNGAEAAIDFYKKAFDAKEKMIIYAPDKKLIVHAEITIGNSIIMLSEEMPQRDMPSPKMLKGTPVCLTVYVNDVDKTFEQAVNAGAQALRPVENQFYGDRAGYLEDPFGHRWAIMTHVEDVSPEELHKRMMAQCDKSAPETNN
ncbi:MAG: VOC family protein [Candidatus Omnitrophica bacterium]|nr:VOC family protein [Candidatus Omnitrophota bacterium]